MLPEFAHGHNHRLGWLVCTSWRTGTHLMDMVIWWYGDWWPNRCWRDRSTRWPQVTSIAFLPALIGFNARLIEWHWIIAQNAESADSADLKIYSISNVTNTPKTSLHNSWAISKDSGQNLGLKLRRFKCILMKMSRFRH